MKPAVASQQLISASLSSSLPVGCVSSYVVVGKQGTGSGHTVCMYEHAATNAGCGLSSSLCPREDEENQSICLLKEGLECNICNTSLKVLMSTLWLCKAQVDRVLVFCGVPGQTSFLSVL